MEEIKELLGIVAEYVVMDAHRKGIMQNRTATDLKRIREITAQEKSAEVKTLKVQKKGEIQNGIQNGSRSRNSK